MAGHGLIQQQQERRLRPHPERDLKCPRCASTNTKFCYYNNYSLSQPRYFCKGCRRYWTLGGSLRNVPVGGGCRKNKRSSSSSSSSSSSYSKKAQELDLTSTPLLPTLIPPPLTYDPSDLTFRLQKHPPMVQFGLDDNSHNLNPALSAPAPTNGFLDTLGHGFLDITRPIGFNHLYHGYGVNGRLEEIGGDKGGLGGATTGQGSCEATDGGGDTKAFTGLSWQEGSMDSARDCWNGAVGSSLHGLINSSML